MRGSSTFADQLRQHSPRWALIADDLTGAADAAVEFSEAGFSVSVCRTESAVSQCQAEICAVTTETRELEEDSADDSVRRWAAVLKDAGRQVIFLKVDSMLRGNPLSETKALVEAAGFDRALLCPALPRLGRICREGYLRTQDNRDVALPTEPWLLTPSAGSDADLADLAEGLLGNGEAVLPVGSSGLARPWAKVLAGLHSRKARRPAPPVGVHPTLCVIGSVHPRTLEQMAFAMASGALEEAELDGLIGVSPSRSQLVRITLGEVGNKWVVDLRAVVGSGAFDSLVLSGGSTAGAVFEALGIDALDMGGSTTAGAPWGTIRGRMVEGLTTVTKSGAFGNPDELERIVRSLN